MALGDMKGWDGEDTGPLELSPAPGMGGQHCGRSLVPGADEETWRGPAKRASSLVPCEDRTGRSGQVSVESPGPTGLVQVPPRPLAP